MEDVSSQIIQALEKYTDDERKKIKKIITQASAKCTAELVQKSPVSKIAEINGKKYYVFKNGERVKANARRLKSGKYAKSWHRHTICDTNISVEYVIANDISGLPHLLENGHMNRDGSRTAPIKHIQECENNAIDFVNRRIDEEL